MFLRCTEPVDRRGIDRVQLDAHDPEVWRVDRGDSCRSLALLKDSDEPARAFCIDDRMNHIVVFWLLAAAIPSPGPSTSAAPKTIVTVKSSLYCNALARHFNAAFVPLLANDRTFDGVDQDLVDINALFSKPDFQMRFVDTRRKLMASVKSIEGSIDGIDGQINALAAAEATTNDPAAAQALRSSVDELRRAYVRQRSLLFDVQGVVQTMMDYDITNRDHPLGGNALSDLGLPADAKDLKSYLRFDGQRDVIAAAEEKAVDTALDAATAYCSGTHP